MSSQDDQDRVDADPSGGAPPTGSAGHAGSRRDRTADGVDHLQAAAREMIGAARAFLDVVEDLVEDREALDDFAAGVGTALGEVARAAERAARPGGGPAAGDTGADDDEDGGRVQRIRVS